MDSERRKILGGTFGIAAASFFGGASTAFASPEDVAATIESLYGDARIFTGKITLLTPEIAENGNSVPISVTVESPMTEFNYVESVAIFAEDNPLPEVVTFNFFPESGEASASTRMRLARTQNVVAIAKMSNGLMFSDARNVKVTIGGCGG